MTNSNDSSAVRTAAWQEWARRHPDDPYAWSRAHRTLNGEPLLHQWAIADLVRDRSPLVVVRKSAQVGISEAVFNLGLWAADTHYAGRGNVLHMMPTQNMMDDFAQARIDRALQDSPYLRRRLQPEPPLRKGADSKRLKRIGDGYYYLRGTDSRRQIASVDADFVILDEFDQMAEGTLDLARKRLTSSKQPRLWLVSTPRLPGAGIDEIYRHSDQHRYFLTCTACGREQALSWAKNVDIERIAIVCRDCRADLDTRAKGRWIPQAPGNSERGYHLSRLYSPWLNLPAMIESSQSTSLFARQEFYNSDLGLPFVQPNGGLTLDELDRSRVEYDFCDYDGAMCAAGVDVGGPLHVVIREQPDVRKRPEDRSPAILWFAGEVKNFEELERLLQRFQVKECVIDALPEWHKAREFAEASRSRVWLAYYTRRDRGHERVPGYPDRYDLDRTLALDEMVDAFRTGNFVLPANARELGGRMKQGMGEYYREMLALQRVIERNAQGNPEARWVDNGRDDHYAHAEAYCLRAMDHVPSIMFNGDAQTIMGVRPAGPFDFGTRW